MILTSGNALICRSNFSAHRKPPTLQSVIDGAIGTDRMDCYQRFIDQGKNLDAFAYFSIVTGPKRARRMPRWLMKLMLPIVVGREHLESMLALLPENLREHQAQAELNDTHDGYREIKANVLLMSGTPSEIDWVPVVMEKLQEVIPSVEARQFRGLDHMAPMTHAPNQIAQAITAHFKDS
jgi:hypothetical protein